MKNRTSAHTRMQIMVTCAMLVAIQIVLVRFLSIQTPFQRVSFGFLPIAMAGMLFGPGYGCAVAGISDLLGATIFPTGGAFWPGFTIVTACSGLVYGLLLHEKSGENWSPRKRIIRIVIAVAIVNVFVHIILGTLNLAIMYDKGFLALVFGRIGKEPVHDPRGVGLYQRHVRGAGPAHGPAGHGARPALSERSKSALFPWKEGAFAA